MPINIQLGNVLNNKVDLYNRRRSYIDCFDNCNGNISDSNITGTVNYQTGDINLTFITIPNADTNVTLDYNYEKCYY